jgi:hypothetical protein
MKRYPYSTKLPKVDVMALQVWSAPPVVSDSIPELWSEVIGIDYRGAKKVWGQERFEILGVPVAYMMMSFFLQHSAT